MRSSQLPLTFDHELADSNYPSGALRHEQHTKVKSSAADDKQVPVMVHRILTYDVAGLIEIAGHLIESTYVRTKVTIDIILFYLIGPGISGLTQVYLVCSLLYLPGRFTHPCLSWFDYYQEINGFYSVMLLAIMIFTIILVCSVHGKPPERDLRHLHRKFKRIKTHFRRQKLPYWLVIWCCRRVGNKPFPVCARNRAIRKLNRQKHRKVRALNREKVKLEEDMSLYQ